MNAEGSGKHCGMGMGMGREGWSADIRTCRPTCTRWVLVRGDKGVIRQVPDAHGREVPSLKVLQQVPSRATLRGL